ncbi:hypothetical protein ACFQU1_24210 [Chelatococcus sp. GCM10030263]|uniref:hypothetical protein n=1 Tax=Chelatococcus sp. GCM10030263 TaxID=3273387 RepID=UPI003616E594
MKRTDLPTVLEETLRALGGTATIVEVARRIWEKHEAELRASGDLFFTWQYDVRWAAQRLRDAKKLTYSRRDTRQVWQLI